MSERAEPTNQNANPAGFVQKVHCIFLTRFLYIVQPVVSVIKDNRKGLIWNVLNSQSTFFVTYVYSNEPCPCLHVIQQQQQKGQTQQSSAAFSSAVFKSISAYTKISFKIRVFFILRKILGVSQNFLTFRIMVHCCLGTA